MYSTNSKINSVITAKEKFNQTYVPKQILMMPDYRQDNPYQTLLAEALRSQFCQVSFPGGYRRVFPIYRAIQDHKSDILHLHWLTPYLKGENWLVRLIYSCKLILDLWLTRFTGIKIVWTVHNHLAHNCPFPRMELWLRKQLTGLVNQIIVHNHSSIASLHRSWNLNNSKHSSKFKVIPHGNYCRLYQPAIDQAVARKKLNLPSDGYLYLNLGMIRPYKGIEDLLQVWQSNQEIFQIHNLLVVGQPLNLAYGKKISILARNNKVILRPDFIPSEQIHLYFSAADVIVLPFSNILTSGSLILAMSYGKPIIAPCKGGISETLGQANSLLYDPSDRQGLLNALKNSTQINLKQLRHQVRLVSNRLDWEQIAQTTAQLYFN